MLKGPYKISDCGWGHGIKVAAAFVQRYKACQNLMFGKRIPAGSHTAESNGQFKCRAAPGSMTHDRSQCTHLKPRQIIYLSLKHSPFYYLVFLLRALWEFKYINFCSCTFLWRKNHLAWVPFSASHCVLSFIQWITVSWVYGEWKEDLPKTVKCLSPALSTQIPEWWECWRTQIGMVQTPRELFGQQMIAF